MKPEKLYHYTTGVYLEAIMKEGVLGVSRYDKSIGAKHPAVWFSVNSIWEPTATKATPGIIDIRFLTFEEQYQMFGCARITVAYSDEFITWAKYRHLCKNDKKYPPHILDSMEATGYKKGSDPKHWYCSIKDIVKDKILNFEIWDGQGWAAVPQHIN